MKVLRCKNCNMTVFEGETRCQMCGGVVFEDAGMHPIAEEMLIRVAAGEPFLEVYSGICRRIAREVLKQSLQELVKTAAKKLEDDES